MASPPASAPTGACALHRDVDCAPAACINGALLNKRGAHGGFKVGSGSRVGRIGIEEFLEYQSVMG